MNARQSHPFTFIDSTKPLPKRRRTDWMVNKYDELRDELGPFAALWIGAYAVVVICAAVSAIEIFEGFFL